MKKVLIFSILVLFLGSLIALESDPSEVVGFVKYNCVTNSNGNYNLMAIPMDAGYTLASELGADYPAITSLRHWDSTNQNWVASNNLGGGFWAPDNAIDPNEVYFINVNTNIDVYIAGGMNADPSYNLVINTNGNYNTIMLPLDSPFILASELGNDIGVCTSIREWNEVAQGWVASNNLGGGFWAPDNAVSVAQSYFINVSANTTWPTTDVISSSPFEPAPSKSKNIVPVKQKNK